MSTVTGRLSGSCCANFCNASALRANKATFAPRSDSASAVDSPIPDEAPVTMKTRSLICKLPSSYFNSTIPINQRAALRDGKAAWAVQLELKLERQLDRAGSANLIKRI